MRKCPHGEKEQGWTTRSLFVIRLRKNFCGEFDGLILGLRGKIFSPGPIVEHARTSRAKAALCRLRAEDSFCHDFSAMSQCSKQPEEMQVGSHLNRRKCTSSLKPLQDYFALHDSVAHFAPECLYAARSANCQRATLDMESTTMLLQKSFCLAALCVLALVSLLAGCDVAAGSAPSSSASATGVPTLVE